MGGSSMIDAPDGAEQRRAGGTRPNVLLVMCDTARADALEPYGAPAGSTPTFADLARSGTVFPRAYATANWTMPSHASLFTGRLPRTMGIGRGGSLQSALSRHAEIALPTVLRAHGYRTGAVSANPLVNEGVGFGHGFERFASVRGRPVIPGPEVRARARWLASAVKARADAGMTRAGEVLRSWIDEQDDRPFFFFVNLMECHTPYLPQRPHADRSPLKRLVAGLDAMRYQRPERMYRICIGEEQVSAAALSRMHHHYRQAVTSMDTWLAGILEHLDDRSALRDTVVVVTSDHGENFGENGLVTHAMSLDERLVRVPLIMAGPGVPESPPDLVSLADIPAVLASVLGITDHPWGERASPDGTVVMQTDGLAALPDAAIQAWADALGLDRQSMGKLTEPFTAVSDGRFKLVKTRRGSALYDLDADPLEQQDVAGTHPTDLNRLRPLVEAHIGLDAATPVMGAGELGELETRMSDLGYL